MFYLKNLWSKFRYSSPLRIVTDVLGRLGIRITPYYIFLEGLEYIDPSGIKTDFSGYETVLMGPDDMQEIAKIPGREFVTLDSLHKRLARGDHCLGMKYNDKLVGFAWANLREVTFSNAFNQPLKDNEAYLYDAYTLMEFRGIGIAPFIRYKSYQQLEQLGKNRLYSISLVLNTPAIKFKQKLNAERYELRLFIDFLRKWKMDTSLKKF